MPNVAPWWSNGSPFQAGSASKKFLGIYGLSAEMLSDSTRTAPTTEGINSGGVIGTARRAVKGVTFTVQLTALDEDGLEYGMAWLTRALNEATGGKLTPSCGAVDLTFFTECPPPFDPAEGIDKYRDRIRSITRVLHDVKAVSGPIVRRKMVNYDKTAYGYLVEFTLHAGVPYIFGIPNDTFLVPNIGEVVISDIVYNLQQFPSAELTQGTVVIAENYALNPSVESNATDWTGGGSSIAGVTSARSTELAAVGTASFKVLAQPTAAGTGGFLYADLRVPIPGAGGRRYSISMWGSGSIQSGTAVIQRLRFFAFWQNAANNTLRTDPLGEAPIEGGSVSMTGIVPPTDATQVVVRAQLDMTSYAASSAFRLYADAVAVTVP